MQYLVVKQIAVEAESPEEAVANLANGLCVGLNVMIRPQPQGMNVTGAPAGFTHVQTPIAPVQPK